MVFPLPPSYRNILIAGASAISAVGLSSCTADDIADKSSGNSQTVRFNVEVNDGWTLNGATRTAEETAPFPKALALREGERPLYLVPEVASGINVRKGETRQTRSSLTSRDEIADFGVFASLKPESATDIKDLSPNYMWNVEVKRDNDWAPVDPYLMPGSGALHFNAYSPYTANAGGDSGVTSLPLATDKGELYLSYTTPADVEAQEDLLVAEAADIRTSPCDLVFDHALTAIRFATGTEMHPCRIKSVSITGVNSKGVLNMETGEWTKLSVPQTFTVNPDMELTAAPGSDYVAPDTYITSEEETFLLIPQALSESAAIQLVVVEYGMETTLEVSLAGTVWQPGKTVTYKISANPRLGSFILDITDAAGNPVSQLTSDYSGSTFHFNVKSSFGNPSDPALQKDIPWKAEFIDSDGNVISKPDWISKWTMSGAGSAELSFTTSRQTPVFEGVSPESAALRSAQDVNETSGYRPFNLANSTGQASVQNTANCYLVHAPGFYAIPLVYGNAITGGKTNTSAYESTNHSNIHVLNKLVNHLGNAITDPYIYNNAGCVPEDAELIWEGRMNLLQKVQLSPDKKRLIFVVTPEDICQGNAIVAVRDASGVVLWSWHIWVTPYRPDDNPIPIAYHGKNYQLMSQNLGQVSSGDRVNFKERTAKVRFSQVPTDGSEPVTVTLDVVQKGKLISAPAAYNYYQWGRKDPMISDIAEWYTSTTGEVTKLWTKNFAVDRTPGLSIISDYIRTPGYFWVSPHEPEVFPYYNLWNTNFSTTDEVKTIYDPSPPGYMVSRNVLTGLQNSPSEKFSGNYGVGVNVTIPATNQVVFFPTQGFRSSIDGTIQGRETGAEIGSVWTSRTTSTTDATVLVIDATSELIQVQGLEVRANAYGVRAAKEL